LPRTRVKLNLSNRFAAICHNLVLHFYDRENRGVNQVIVRRIYFGLFLELLTDLTVQTPFLGDGGSGAAFG